MKFMAITMPRAELVAALQLCGSVVNRRQIIPILSNVKIVVDAEEKRVAITASNIDMTVESHVPARVKNAGATTVEHRALLDAIRSLEAEEVSLALETNGTLTVTCGTATYTLLTLPADDFPLPAEFTPVAHASLPAADIKAALRSTSYATTEEEIRFRCSGVLMRKHGKHAIDIAATDGHRMALLSLETGVELKHDAFVPAKAVDVIERLTGEELLFEIEDRLLRVIGDNGTLLVRVPDVNFPNYRDVVAKLDKRATVDRTRLLAMVKRASMFANERTRALRFEFEPGKVRVLSVHGDGRTANEYMPIDYAGAKTHFGISGSYAAQVLDAINTAHIGLLFDNEESQIQFVPEPPLEHGEAVHVVMPLRLA